MFIADSGDLYLANIFNETVLRNYSLIDDLDEFIDNIAQLRKEVIKRIYKDYCVKLLVNNTGLSFYKDITKVIYYCQLDHYDQYINPVYKHDSNYSDAVTDIDRDIVKRKINNSGCTLLYVLCSYLVPQCLNDIINNNGSLVQVFFKHNKTERFKLFIKNIHAACIQDNDTVTLTFPVNVDGLGGYKVNAIYNGDVNNLLTQLNYYSDGNKWKKIFTCVNSLTGFNTVLPLK